MSHRANYLVATALAALSSGLLAACGSDNTVAPITVNSLKPDFLVGDDVTTTSTPVATKIKLCTIGNDGTFSIAATPVAGGTPTVIASPTTIPAGKCIEVVDDNDGPNVGANVVITETSPGLVSDTARLSDGTPAGATKPYTDGVTQLFVNQFHGWTVVYVNTAPPPPPSNQGCSPGYWKNHTAVGKWPAPYTPNEQFSAVFENAFPGKTLEQVLSTGGGGLTALGRQTVGALLNAAKLGAPNFGLSSTQVINMFNSVFPGGNYGALQTTFENLTDVNGRVCPLN